MQYSYRLLAVVLYNIAVEVLFVLQGFLHVLQLCLNGQCFAVFMHLADTPACEHSSYVQSTYVDVFVPEFIAPVTSQSKVIPLPPL